MPKLKRASRRQTRDAPQSYEPRVEVVLFALADALVGCQMLVRFLTAQQGADWAAMNKLLDAAGSDFEKSKVWLDKRHKTGGRNV